MIDGETFVQGDTNGDGIADLILRISGDHTLTVADFVGVTLSARALVEPQPTGPLARGRPKWGVPSAR